jgi:hypothetical protein
MQLTANLAILATAVAYSVPSVLALPIAGTTESIIARDAQYELDAREVFDFDLDEREVDDIAFAARDLISQYHQAREYYDELDTRSFGDDLEVQAREFYKYLVARTVNDDQFVTVHNDKKKHVLAIVASPNFKKLPAGLQKQLTDEATFLRAEPPFHPSEHTDRDGSFKFKKERVAELEKISQGLASGNTNSPEFNTAVQKEEAYQKKHAEKKGSIKRRELSDRLFSRSEPHNSLLDPELKNALDHPDGHHADYQEYAKEKNIVLNLFDKIEQSGTIDSVLKAEVKKELEAKKAHLAALKAKDATALAKSAAYKAEVAQVKSGQGKTIVSEVKKHAERLQHIVSGGAPAQQATKDEIAYLKGKNTGSTPASPASPVVGLPANGAAKQKLRRRRF